MIKEFKEFISRGNMMDVVDLAVGVIIGGAFSTIVSSLVNDILMPVIGIILGGINFTNLAININDAKIMYGSFIQNVIDFLIVAFCVFIFVKFINGISRLGQKKKENEGKIKEIPESELSVLIEIRNELKKSKPKKTKKKTDSK